MRQHDAEACRTLFAALLPVYPQFFNLNAVRPDGQVFCSAQPTLRPLHVAGVLAFQRVLHTRGFALGDRQKGQSGRDFFAAVMPALDERGEVIAAWKLPSPPIQSRSGVAVRRCSPFIPRS